MVTLGNGSSTFKRLWGADAQKMDRQCRIIISRVRLDRITSGFLPFRRVEKWQGRIPFQIRIYTVQMNVSCVGKSQPIDLAASRNDDLVRAARDGKAMG